jgi:hypothetical protein
VSAPSVYAAIHAVAADLAKIGIAKDRTNIADDYKYRSIDDVLGSLAPLLAKHRLCVLPRVFERIERDRGIEGDGLCVHVTLQVGYTLTSVDDGTSHIVEAYGEALDASDKATAKAMSAAYKSAMVQTFCIPAWSGEDADHSSRKVQHQSHQPEPVQGWQRWTDDIIDIIAVCESERALAVVQERHRALLVSLSRERPELYTRLGESFTSRRERLRQRTSETKAPRPATKARSSPKALKPLDQVVEHA